MAIVNLGSCSQDTACRRHTAVLNVESDGSIVHSSIVNPSSNLDELEEITTIPIITTPTQNQGSVKRHFWFCKGGNEGGGASVSSSTISGVNHSAHAAERQQELSLGLTLVAISILFIVCQSVKLIPDVYELLLCEKDKTGQCSSTGFIDQLISLANLLSCINSSANFLVYMLRGKKFRDAFLVTYGCRIRRRTSTQRYLLRQQTTRTSIMGHHNITEVQQLRSNSVRPTSCRRAKNSFKIMTNMNFL